MKKLFAILGIAMMISGCASSPSSGVMTCTSKNDNEATNAIVTMELTYEDSLVISQNAKTSLTAKNADIYEQVKTIASNSELEYKQISGTTYEKTIDEEAMSLEEFITLDFKKISKEDFQKVVSYRQVEDLNVQDIKKSLEEQGFTCTIK